MTEQLSIAETVLGTNNDVNPPDGIRAAFNRVMGLDLDEDKFSALRFKLGELIKEDPIQLEINPDISEAFQAIDWFFQIFIEGKIVTANNLGDWPVYQALMAEHGEKQPGAALLIGSFTPISSAAFVSLAQEVYGADQAYVVDIRASKAKTRIGNFVFGSGTDLPFDDGSFSFIHTNRLLVQLEEPRDEDFDDAPVERLFKEIARVLRPGGQLLMVETSPLEIANNPGMYELLSQGILEALSRHGLSVGVAEPVYVGSDPEMLFDRHRDFDSYNVPQHAGTAAIYARKPMRSAA